MKRPGNRILVDARTGWGSGIGRYIANVVPRVAALCDELQFEVIVPHAEAARARHALADPPNLSLTFSDIAPFSMREQVALPRLAQGHDLTWFTNYWVPLRWHGRFIAVVHDLIHLEPALFPASWAKRRLAHRTFAKLRRASALVYVSRFTQREYERRFGPSPALSRTIHLGVDHGGWVGSQQALSAPAGKRLLIVAAAKQHKNFRRALDAWSQARVPGHWTLTIVTPDDALRSSVDLDTLVQGSAKVDVRRGTSDADLKALYADTAIMLLPSLYEGFGLPLLEAMQGGALCVCSTAGSMVEIAEGAFVQFVNGDDTAGWAEAIERCCAMVDTPDIDLAPILSHNKGHADRFTWANTAAETATVIRNVFRAGGVNEGAAIQERQRP